MGYDWIVIRSGNICFCSILCYKVLRGGNCFFFRIYPRWWFEVFFNSRACLGKISIVTNVFSNRLKPSPTIVLMLYLVSGNPTSTLKIQTKHWIHVKMNVLDIQIPTEVVLSHYLHGFIHPKWLALGFLPSTVLLTFGLWPKIPPHQASFCPTCNGASLEPQQKYHSSWRPVRFKARQKWRGNVYTPED